MTDLAASLIKTLIIRYPSMIPHLTGRARWIALGSSSEVKTYDYFERELSRMISNVYNNNLGGEFIDLLASLIYGQLEQAFRQAWTDEGDGTDFPQYLADAFEIMYLDQFNFVDQLYRDIIDARVDETPIDPLLARASQWAQSWNTAYRQAVEMIHLEDGGNLQWIKGETEHGCATCAALDGIVMSAREWQELDVHPRAYPNPKLECEGGGPSNNCDCTLEPTDQRRSPDAYGIVIGIVSK